MYERECTGDESPKDWNFIKVHSHTHAARDIQMKGVINNMDTKPSEKLNRAMRAAYQLQTNFKNVEGQVRQAVNPSTGAVANNHSVLV